jgi:hypothetical protein
VGSTPTSITKRLNEYKSGRARENFAWRGINGGAGAPCGEAPQVMVSFMGPHSEFGQIEWARVRTARSQNFASKTY